MYPPESCDVIIEDSKLNGAALRRTGIPAQDIKIAYNSGSNRRESQLLAEGLRRRGYNVVAVKPLRHVTAAGATNKRGKMTAEFFSRLTGWDKPTSEHGRDAGILCWGVKECRQQESEKVA